MVNYKGIFFYLSNTFCISLYFSLGVDWDGSVNTDRDNVIEVPDTVNP